MNGFENMKTPKNILLPIIAPLGIGFVIYLFLHKPNLLIHFYSYKIFPFANYYAIVKNNFWGCFLIYHLPDMLWAYSLGVFLIYFLSFINNKFVKAAIVLVIGSFTEIVQLFFPNSFTFDWLDLLYILITLTFLINNYEIKKKN